MADVAGLMADELVTKCITGGYVEKKSFEGGVRYIIRSLDLFIELHVVSEGGEVYFEIWDYSTSASPMFTRSFNTSDLDVEFARAILCRVYKLILLRRISKITYEGEVF